MTNKKWTGRFILLLIWIILPKPVLANVRLPFIISSNMVLQRDTETLIWGWADSDKNITVFFRDKEYKTKPEKNGKWKLMIETGKAGGPFCLTVKGENTILLENILVGDVWVCSGQSNMELPLSATNNSGYELPEANYPVVRFFNVPNNLSTSPLDNTLTARWEVCSPESAESFSAAGYYFGKKIQLETGIPIGLISADWGATTIESWISEEALRTDDVLAEYIKILKNVDQEYLAKEQARIYEDYYLNLYKVYLPDYTHEFLDTDFNDTDWENILQPQPLGTTHDLKNFDGVMWYGKSFDIPKGFDPGKASLSLSYINDNDITWVNGRRIGETYFRKNTKRNYEILPGVLTQGRNTLILRVEGYSSDGGFKGASEDMYLTDGILSINLSGIWKLRKDTTRIPHNPSVIGETELLPNLFYATLFNGMIAPILTYTIKGAIWYQGESNADGLSKAYNYENLLTLMISDWRKHWGIGDFPFYIVQLANFGKETVVPQTEIWPFLREAQANTAKKVKNTGMACSIDIGDAADIHPRNKASVGERLALNALKYDFGKDIVCRGPIMEKTEFRGNKVLVSFNTHGSTLKVNNKYGYITGFAVAGHDKKFYYAKAILFSGNQVEVQSDKVEDIKSVRFLWADNPGEVTMYNSSGLPAEPFRTDNW